MNTRPTTRHLDFEPLTQRVLLAADVINPAQQAIGPEHPDPADVAGDIDACSIEKVNGLDELHNGTPSSVREVQLENGDQFIFGGGNTGQLLRSNGSQVAFRDVETIQDPNYYFASPSGGGSTAMAWFDPPGKEQIGSYRTEVKELGNDHVLFRRVVIYGVADLDPCDVNGDGDLTPRDALLVVNDFNAHGFRRLNGEGEAGNTRVDVNGDGWISPIDLLRVINALNRQAELQAIPVCYPEPSEPPAAATVGPSPLVPVNGPDAWRVQNDSGLLADHDAESAYVGLPAPLDSGVPRASQTYGPLHSSPASLVDADCAPYASARATSNNEALDSDSAWAARVDKIMSEKLVDIDDFPLEI